MDRVLWISLAGAAGTAARYLTDNGDHAALRNGVPGRNSHRQPHGLLRHGGCDVGQCRHRMVSDSPHGRDRGFSRRLHDVLQLQPGNDEAVGARRDLSRDAQPGGDTSRRSRRGMAGDHGWEVSGTEHRVATRRKPSGSRNRPSITMSPFSQSRVRPPICPARPPPQPPVRHRRHPVAGARHRRQHGDFHADRPDPAAQAAGDASR